MNLPNTPAMDLNPKINLQARQGDAKASDIANAGEIEAGFPAIMRELQNKQRTGQEEVQVTQIIDAEAELGVDPELMASDLVDGSDTQTMALEATAEATTSVTDELSSEVATEAEVLPQAELLDTSEVAAEQANAISEPAIDDLPQNTKPLGLADAEQIQQSDDLQAVEKIVDSEMDSQEEAAVSEEIEVINAPQVEDNQEPLIPVNAVAQALIAEADNQTQNMSDDDLLAEKARLMEQFRIAADMASNRSSADRNVSQLQSAVETVVEAPSAVIQKLQHSLSNAPLLSRLMGRATVPEQSPTVKLEPAVQAAMAMVSNLNSNSNQPIDPVGISLNLNAGKPEIAVKAPLEVTPLGVPADDLETSNPLQTIMVNQASTSGGSSQVSFLPTSNLHAITSATASLIGTGQSVSSANVSSEVLVADRSPVQNTQRMEIQLVPKSLGVIEVSLQRTDAGVSIQIQAQTADAERLLNSDRQTLNELMRSAGIVVDEIKVSTNPNLSDNFDSNRSTQNQLTGYADRSEEHSNAEDSDFGSRTHDGSETQIEGNDPGLLGPEQDLRDGIYL